MSKNIQTISKWIPSNLNDFINLFKDCNDIRKMCATFVKRISSLLDNLKNKHFSKMCYSVNGYELDIQDIEDTLSTMEELVKNFTSIFLRFTKEKRGLLSEKFNIWKEVLWKNKLKTVYLVQELISEIAYLYVKYGERILVLTLRISTSYNDMLVMDTKYNISNSMSICSNSCPYLLFPLRKISVTTLLQILASSRAELCCHKLIDCLLDTYRLYESQDDDDNSSDSSMEIYKALTKHMSPPFEPDSNKKIEKVNNLNDSGSLDNIDQVLKCEEKHVTDLLAVTLTIAPSMLGRECTTKTSTGVIKINSRARNKVLGYYQEILWGEAGIFLEHIVLWWATSALYARPPHSSQHLREWINQFIPSAELPQVILSALTSLSDALGVHVNLTSWDQHFRLALVASKMSCNPETGKLFSNVLQELTMLTNQCEETPDWIIGAPLDELPLVEQIPILHRLDHSIHTTRLWAISESKKLANNWNVDAFFKVTEKDIVSCIKQLDALKMTDHTIEIEKGGLGAHVQVCVLMRAKLVSEVKINVEKLKNSTKDCVDILASVCRTTSLANLQMIFPPSSYWRTTNDNSPEKPSDYVEKFLNQILTSVLLATKDQIVVNMILKIMCESWLDHIYTNKIKFSQYGARQLLVDFAHVETWLNDSDNITPKMRKKMSKNEVLRRCEGVGRLLLRCPGEHIKMVDKNTKSKSSNSSPMESAETELMPAEMYVPNQEQWLELRAVRSRKGPFLATLCCGGKY